ncbi:putative colanic acid biosynthesis acetyltransferase [Pseudomonadota bacterium]
MTKDTDTASNRRQTKYGLTEQFRRVLWGLAKPLFRFSPRIFFGWRNALLRAFGARIGRKVHIYNTAVIYFPWRLEIGDWSAIGEHAFIYNLGAIRIGTNVTISQRAHLCAGTHDHTNPGLPLLKPPITIEDQAWICADAFVGPGVTVGEGSVVGARTVVVKDVEPWLIVVGNPARPVRKREIGAEKDGSQC